MDYRSFMIKRALKNSVILSGAHLREAKMCGVEGSLAVGQRGEPRRDPSTPQNPALAPFCSTQDDNVRSRFGILVGCIALLGFFAFSGCDNPIQTAYQEQLVVNGFIYANEPIDSIVLHRTTPFGSYYDDLDYAVDSATVTITVDGVAHTLLPTGLKGRYYLPASNLIVQGGKTYNLTVIAPDLQTGGVHTATSSTTVPMPIHFSAIADSARGKTFILDTSNLSNFAFIVTAGPVDTPDREYLLSVQALDTSYGRIRGERASSLDSTQTIRYSGIATAPAIAVTPGLFNWYGPNLVTFYAIDTNWSSYQRQVLGRGGTDFQPSLNHITGGIGVFGSAARDTVTIFVKPKN